MKILKKIKDWLFMEDLKEDIKSYKEYIKNKKPITWNDIKEDFRGINGNMDQREGLFILSKRINDKQKRYIIHNKRLIEVGFNDQITVSDELPERTLLNLNQSLEFINGKIEEDEIGLYRHIIVFNRGLLVWHRERIHEFY